MTYPTYTTPRSIPGAATPTYLNASLVSGYFAGQSFIVANTTDWYEVSSSGTATTNPLGTSGVFTLVVDYGSGTEEKILCASEAIPIGVNVPISVWTDGTYNGRGWDGTTPYAHTSGTNSNFNVFPVRTAVDDLQFNTAAANSLVSTNPNLGGVTAISGQSAVWNGISWTPAIINGGITSLTGDVTAIGTGAVAATLVGTTSVSGVVNVIINANSTVTGTVASLATLSGQYVVTSGIVTAHTGYIATISGKQVTDEANIASLSGNLATLSGQYVVTSGSLTTLSGQFVALSGAYATTSGNLNTTNSNLSTLSGQFVTLSGQYNTTSGIVTNNTNSIATISGKQVTDEANITSLSGSLSTLSGQYNTTSGIVTNNTGSIASISGSLNTLSGQFVTLSGSYATTSGNLNTTNTNVANLSGQFASLSGQYVSTSGSLTTLSGQFVTLSGQYNTTSGIVTTATGNIASLSGSLNTLSGQYVSTSGSLTTLSGQFVALSGSYASTSGSLNTVSGVAYAALPISGGTISGNLTVTGTSTLNNTLTVNGSVTVNGTGNSISAFASSSTNLTATNATITNLTVTGTVTATGIQIAKSQVTGLTTDLTNISGSLTTLSGNLNTVSGVAYAALPRSGGTISGYLTVASGLTVQNNAVISGGLTVNSGSTLYNGIYTTGYLNAQGGGGFQSTLNLFGGLAVQSGNATVNNALITSGLTVQNNAIISGLTVNNNATVNGYSTALGGFYYSTSNKSAAGTSQSTATPINTQYTVVINGTTATSNGQTGQAGVVLPNIAYLGQTILIDNATSNWLLVYPYSTQQIDSAGSSNPVWLAPSAYWEGVAETTGVTGSWASFVPSFNSDSSNSINIAYTNGQIQYGINPVIQATSLTVSGTTTLKSLSVANEVDTGNLTVSSGLTVQNNAIISGGLTVSGTTTLNSLSVANEVDTGNLTVSSGLTVQNNAIISGGLTVSGTSTLNNTLTVNSGIVVNNGSVTVNGLGNSISAFASSSTDLTATNATIADLTVFTNATINNLTVTGTLTATNNEFNGSWYSKTLVNTGYLPNVTAAALPAVQVTVSGYSRYMIVANSSYTNNTGTSCIVWSYITDNGYNLSTLAYTTLTGTGRANLGNNLIVSYGNNALVTFSLNVYSDHTTTGSLGAAEISVIGLS